MIPIGKGIAAQIRRLMKFDSIQKTLSDLAFYLRDLSDQEFTKPMNSLSGSSIGEHTRHIIEFFQELLTGYSSGLVHYDGRQRNAVIQTNLHVALQIIQQLASQIELSNKPLLLKSNICDQDQCIETNYHRELMYAWEHCIHHQALIKVGLIELNKTSVDERFGVAESTLSYRKQCVQ